MLVLFYDGKCNINSKCSFFCFFFNLFHFCLPTLVSPVRLTPGEGKLPPGLHSGRRDQQAEAHRPADSPVPTDLTPHGRTKNKQTVISWDLNEKETFSFCVITCLHTRYDLPRLKCDCFLKTATVASCRLAFHR